ncbi:MAG: alpha-glucosidase/alpha-galactosidase [Kiritimatiellae bacterium]|jgi:alpha-galactosidase|nr:alpha-glucosidase/alpha-galactosidase [Kiritimatiellia bacterium]
MAKITFVGAGSTVFVKNIIGDSMCVDSLKDSDIALYDIDATRLEESRLMLNTLNDNINEGRMKIKGYLGVENRKDALRGASYVVNAIQVGGYEPCTVWDFEIPKKYGLRQTIADTLGIGGIFRGLRTANVMLDVAKDIEDVCPNALLLNYTNPMSIVTGSVLHGSDVKAVGLCHSVQGCANGLLNDILKMEKDMSNVQWKVAGINHMGWLLEVTENGNDLYPEIKKIAAAKVAEARKEGAEKFGDMIRLDMMRNFGYYITESSEHAAEYYPYWIKSQYPELIEEFNIPLDEYPRRCIDQIEGWKKQAKEFIGNPELKHNRSGEYGSIIMDAMETDVPARIGGNVINNGVITNLPKDAIVEVACMVDKNGVQPTYVGDLPLQLAALNRTHINVHSLVIDAALNLKKDSIYQAAFLDPHTSAELSLDKIREMCDEFLEVEKEWLPEYK